MKRKRGFYTFVSFALLLPQFTSACISCNRLVREGIYGETFKENLLVLILGFSLIGIALFAVSKIWHAAEKKKSLVSLKIEHPAMAPLGIPAVVLGVGLGGFIDGIVFHQILQWHEMFSAQIDPTDYVGKSINMYWDGVFHFLCLIVVLIGIIMLWRLPNMHQINRSKRLLFGGLLMGWAIFNTLEGTLNHLLLKVHHVLEYTDEKTSADLIFLASSLLIFLIGLFMVNTLKVQR